MKKILLILAIIIIILIAAGVGGYFSAGYFLNKYLGPEYLLAHPTIAKFFNASPVCPTTCAEGGVCGKDGKNYCNQCIALQNRAGFNHNGPCLKTYTNKNYGFSITFSVAWSDYSVILSSWEGFLIDKPKQHYKGETLIFKNQKLADEKQFQGIPIMIITPDVWQLISEEKVAVSAAPIGPEKIGENSKYVFATPPRWYGFGDTLDQAEVNEILDIVKTFKAF